MKFGARSLFLVALCAFLAITLEPARADAHGIGGLGPSNTTAKVISVKPPTSDFKAESIENGDRFKITRTNSASVIIFGVDSEPYIKLDINGVFINQKSATRLINQSTRESISKKDLNIAYAKTSSDPNEPPVWKKVSSASSYIFHDHRTHYMGSVPNGNTNLGTNELNLRVGNIDYTVTISFRSSKIAFPYMPLIAFGLGLLLISLFILLFREKFISLFNQKVTFFALTLLAIFETIHVIGYSLFAHNSFIEETSSSIYSIAIIFLSLTCLYKILKHNKHERNWDTTLRSLAPLITATGFIALAAGSLSEYESLYFPYLATTIPTAFSRFMILMVGYLATLVLALGLINIKYSENIEEHQQVSLN